MKEDLVKEFLGKGKLLTPQALEHLAGGSAVAAVENTGLIVTERDIRTDSPNYRILKNITGKKTSITTEDFVRFYKSKYEKIRDIISGRMRKNFISLNKLDNYRNEIYVIGIVRDIREQEDKIIIELEDPTTSVPIIFEKAFDKNQLSEIELDDVVAVKAVSAKNVMFGKQIIFPDIPLRQPQTGRGKACFVSNLNIDEAPKSDVENFFSWFSSQNIEYLFIAGNVGDREGLEKYVNRYCRGRVVFFAPGEKDSFEEYPQLPVEFDSSDIVSLSNPSVIEVGGIKVLLTHKFGVSMLKKRYIGKTKTVLDEDYLVLDEVPDVVCFGHSSDPQVINYKAVTIVCSGSMMANFRPVVIDFETRETTQVQI